MARARMTMDASLPPSLAINNVELLCDRHARNRRGAPALISVGADGGSRTYSFGELADLSRRFASVLTAAGIGMGDRVALLLPQGPEMPIALLGCWRIGAIAVPIAAIFAGPGLEYRLAHSASRAIVTDAAGCCNVAAIRNALGELAIIWSVDSPVDGATRSFWNDLKAAKARRAALPPGGERPAYIMYTSGTTGRAKGVIHTHRGFQATMPGVATIHHDVQPDDVAWSPAAWSWIAGFGGLLLFFLHAGRPVIAWDPPHPFDPDRVLDFLARHRVRNTLLTPTMLRLMSGSTAPPLALRTLLCTGEAVTADLNHYCRNRLNVIPCEAYGQTECAPIAVNNPRLMPERLGALGQPVPDMTLAILDPAGQPLGPGERGEIAVGDDHSSVFAGYWKDAATTGDKLRGGWLMTGDEGWRDADGFFWFVGRTDDVIKSSGYRIGPADIEACLATHPAVELVAAFGLPDAARGARVTAAVKVRPGIIGDDALAAELVAFGRDRLERHEYPRQVLFIDDMPLTVTGKVMRKDVRQRFASGG